jgi:hypothetical protein
MTRTGIVVLALLFAGTSQADLLWDYGMTTGTYYGDDSNITTGQNFADVATFSTGVSISEYDLFTALNPQHFTDMHVKVLADDGGLPGSVITEQDAPVTNAIVEGVFDNQTVYRVVIHLDTIHLAAGTYWFGASGNGFDAGQITLDPGPGSSSLAQFSGTTYSTMAIGDQAYRLFGTVPEPAGASAVACLTLAALRRRKRA